ncbi:UNVERIFIED_CONTAM: hypothetical protein RMT77_008551 [Armadillidium vulgare]
METIPLFIAVESGHQSLVKELLHYHGRDQVKEVRASTRDTALHIACLKKDTDMVRLLIDAGINLNERNANGQTALHIAAEEGDEATAKFFYNIHANPNLTDKQDRTPLHVAAEKGNTLIVDLLAEKFRASVMERTKDGSTLAHIASLHGHPDTVMAFIKKGVPLHMPNKSGARCLHTAAQRGHVGVVHAILQKGELVDALTNDGYTALHVAVQYGRANVVEALLGWGANLKIKGGTNQESPLHLAARVRDGEKCAEMLLKSGADPNLPREDGQTPLHLASQHGNIRCLKLLLEDVTKPQSQSLNGETALHLATKALRVDVAKILIDNVKRKNGDEAVAKLINTMNIKGETALHYLGKLKQSKSGQDKEMSRVLLSNGGDLMLYTHQTKETPIHYVALTGNETVLAEMLANVPPEKMQTLVNMTSSKGWSPLLSASQHGHVGIVDILLKHQARVDIFDSEGKAALHLAADKGFKPVCNALLSHKAFVNARSIKGLTALHLASSSGQQELVQSLIVNFNAQKDPFTMSKQTPLHLAAERGQLNVCATLLKLGADTVATTAAGQKAVHLAAMNNHSEVVKLFLKATPEIVSTADKDGNTCAHIAALKGSVDVVREILKHNQTIVISGRNRVGESTALHLATQGGHANLVAFLIQNGALAHVEDGEGFTPIHLASRYGHLKVFEVFKKAQVNLRVMSKKLGFTALHVAAYYGQNEMTRELLSHIPAIVKSEPPGVRGEGALLPNLGAEADLTPLHLAAHQGNEGVLRVLLNLPNVLPDVKSKLHQYIPLHLCSIGGHTTCAGLLLSKSVEQVFINDKRGRTSLHIASTHGHYNMVALLISNGAELGAKDKDGWTPVHAAANAGHVDVVRLLIEAGAPPDDETYEQKPPIFFSVASEHVNVYNYLIQQKHNSYKLLGDRKFVHDLTVMSKKYEHQPLQEFILVSPAPVDLATKLAHTLMILSDKEKESTQVLIEASEFSENLAAELLAIAAGMSSPGLLLRAVDNRDTTLLDSLIEHEQKETIARPVVQRYLNEVWMGTRSWPAWKVIGTFLCYFLIPPVWIFFSLPLGHKYNEIPFMKFIALLVSHCYLLILMIITVVTPLKPIWENLELFPNWYEWMLLAWLSGNMVSELTNPGDRGGLGWIKVLVLVASGMGVFIHLISFFYLGNKDVLQELLYVRNNFIGIGLLMASVQILDFLSFHHLFGPWAVIIGKLMVDLGRFLVILSIFMFGFTMYICAIYNPVKPIYTDVNEKVGSGYPPAEAPIQTPLQTGEMLFFSLFGLVEPDYMPPFYSHPEWALTLMKLVFGLYQMVTVVVLINLLIAMMSDTYQRIQRKSDTEWKFGLAKLIRNMSRTSGTPSPLNLILKTVVYMVACCKFRGNLCTDKALEYMKQDGNVKNPYAEEPQQDTAGSFVKRFRSKSRVSALNTSRDNLSAAMREAQGPKRIETVIDWKKVTHRFRLKNKKDVQILSKKRDGNASDNADDANQEASTVSETTPNGTV